MNFLQRISLKMWSRRYLMNKVEHLEAFARMLLVITHHLREYLEGNQTKTKTRKAINYVLNNRLKKLKNNQDQLL